MSRHLTPLEAGEIRRYIIETRARHPELSERAMYKRFIDDHPQWESWLQLPRWRYHFRLLGQEARDAGTDIAQLPVELSGRRIAAPQDATVRELDMAKRQLDLNKQRSLELTHELSRVSREIERYETLVRECFSRLMHGATEHPVQHDERVNTILWSTL